MRGREQFTKAKRLILGISGASSLLPSRLRVGLLTRYRMIGGKRGLLVRYVLLRSVASSCGDNVGVHPGVYMLEPQNIAVGNNVSVHPMCYIDATGGVELGNDVSIAHGVTIMSTTHEYGDSLTPIKDQPIRRCATVVEDGVWIGAKATILFGRRLGRGSIVAAGAVVTKDVLPGQIVAGVPAKVIGERALT